MHKPADVKRHLRRGQRAVCEIRTTPDHRGGYSLWIRTESDRGSDSHWLNTDTGAPMRFPDPVRARRQAKALGFPERWIRVARPSPDPGRMRER